MLIDSNDNNLNLRIESRKEAEREARKADMKQHADKLFQGFKKLEDNHAKRAIWELFQNAIDISEGNCEIEIELNDNEIIFKHNSKPFTSKTLISLIKQVSSKSAQNNDSEVGQYGTGFITTHSFGKKIIINSSIEDNGDFINLDNFEIDRTADLAVDLIDKLASQEEKVFDLIQNGTYQGNPKKLTSFSYQTETPLEKIRAKEALKNLLLIVPYVITLNKKLQSVKISSNVNNFENISYNKGEIINIEGQVNTTLIHCNDGHIHLKTLRSENDEIIVILPIDEDHNVLKFDENLSKLFLFYPLIGSEDFGFNFIIHSKKFSPTEPRDGIYLKSKNEQSQVDEEANRAILIAASEMIFKYLDDYHLVLKNPINLADLNFKIDSGKELLDEYFKSFKNNWVKRLIDLSIVETNVDRISPKSTLFIDKNFFLTEQYLESIYNLINQVTWKKSVPKNEITKEWTEIVSNWECPDIEFITIDDLLIKIQENKTINNYENKNDIQNFYRYLIENNLGKKFDEFKLIPNINGNFCLKTNLKKGKNIHDSFLSIANDLIPSTLESLISSDFILEQEYEVFTRNNLYLSFTQKLQQFYEKENPLEITNDIIQSVVNLCSIFPREDIMSTRKSIVELICVQYNFEFVEIIIPNIEDDRFSTDETPTTALIRIVILDFINKATELNEYIENNLEFLSNFLNLVNSNKLYSETLKSYKIFPSQNFELNYPGDLLKESEFPINSVDSDYLKDIYYKVLSKNVRKELLHNDFSNLDTVTKEKKAKELSLEIDEAFKLENLADINSHTHNSIIIELVEKLTNNNSWCDLFPNLNDKKAIVMMAKISDDEVKGDLFKIIGSNKKRIKLLGELSQRDNLEQIIMLGEAALIEQQKTNADFQFKKQIGVHLEDLIRAKVGSDLSSFKIETFEQQDGQDFVIKQNNEIVYFIEVKSRWDNKNSIMMSKNQMQNSVKNEDIYSLCCIDMCDYHPENGNRHNVEDISLILDRIKVLNKIGAKIKPLINNAMSVINEQNEITLTGDYKATIPQNIVNQGIDINNFVTYLIEKLNLV